MARQTKPKAADAFRTISEAAKELDVPQHVLRHWEEVFGQIRPMRRAGGRRYYRPQDLDLLRGVRELLYQQRYTTKGVQKIFKENGAKYIGDIGVRVREGDQVPMRPLAPKSGADDAANPPNAEVKSQAQPAAQTTPQTSTSDKPSTEENVRAPNAWVAAPAKTAPAGLSDPAVKAQIKNIMARLERVQTYIDEAALAVEAIAPALTNFEEERGDETSAPNTVVKPSHGKINIIDG